MTQYRVVSGEAVVRWPNGRTSGNLLPPGTVIEGELAIHRDDEPPKRRKGYADKSRVVDRDYQDKSL